MTETLRHRCVACTDAHRAICERAVATAVDLEDLAVNKSLDLISALPATSTAEVMNANQKSIREIRDNVYAVAGELGCALTSHEIDQNIVAAKGDYDDDARIS